MVLAFAQRDWRSGAICTPRLDPTTSPGPLAAQGHAPDWKLGAKWALGFRWGMSRPWAAASRLRMLGFVVDRDSATHPLT